MRVSFILPAYYPHPIGGHRVVFEYANHLARRGHTVSILYPRQHAGEAARPFRPSDILWPFKMRLQHRPVVNWQYVHPRVRYRFVASLREASIPDGDVVIATANQTADTVAGLPSRKGTGFYLVQGFEAWGSRTAEQVEATYRLGLKTVAVSKWLADLVRSQGARDVIHIPNAVDHSIFTVEACPEERTGILTLYHHDEGKGVPIALRALSSLHDVRPDVPISMFGVPPRPASLPRWIQYHQSPTAKELAAIYNRHAIYLSASRLEGWGLPPAEAMACGCLFVGTDSKGVRDFCTDGVSALLTSVDDSEALRVNLLRGVEDQALRRRLQAEGTRKIASFTWAKSADKFENFLRGGRR